MAGAAEYYTDPFLMAYRRVSPVGPGVCAVCHSGPGPGYSVCYSCRVTMSQVSRPVTAVLPISLYQVAGQYHHILRYYKDHRSPEVRERLGMVVAATLARFTSHHWTCIASMLGGSPTLVATVPSTRETVRVGEHPLVDAVRKCGRLAALHRPVLARGTGRVGHCQASDGAFRVRDDPRGQLVLLVEDSFTSGARAQSAASVLRRAGAPAVAVVTVGRVIDPAWNDSCRDIWRYACSDGFRFDRCAICADT